MEVQILSVRKKKHWLGAWVVPPGEMKGRKVPVRLEKVFLEVGRRVRVVANHEYQRYQRARAASEEREGTAFF
jgi:hypothetical protein